MLREFFMATTSAVSICNNALAQLGANAIHSLQDESHEAAYCATFYEHARRSCLEKHAWNFAILRVELPPNAAKPLFQYTYQFTLPADCLRILTVNDDPKYNSEGRRIVTDRSTCFLKYVADVADSSTWSQGFIDFLTARMRFDLAYPITKSADQQSIAQSLMERALQQARLIDSSEDIMDDFGPYGSSLISARY